MGQPIEVVGVTQLDDVAMFDTDRSISGQDGVSYGSLEQAAASDAFPAQLASRIMSGVPDVDHVFVASNQVVVRRPGGWDDAGLDAVRGIVVDFFIFYT